MLKRRPAVNSWKLSWIIFPWFPACRLLKKFYISKIICCRYIRSKEICLLFSVFHFSYLAKFRSSSRKSLWSWWRWYRRETFTRESYSGIFFVHWLYRFIGVSYRVQLHWCGMFAIGFYSIDASLHAGSGTRLWCHGN
jgi:hypothetical protein